MKKKIFSILLLLSILVPCLPASAKNSIVNDQIPKFLNTFGFITSENMAADPAEEISRGEFSQYAVNLLDLKYTNDEFVPYSDVKQTRSDYDAIKILNDMGCVKGFGDFTYRPDEKIETEHAVSIILRVMGYGDKYTDVLGFKNLAVGKGLYSGISSVAGLTRKDAFRLIYNALNAEIGDLIYKGSDTEGKTLLTERFKIYFVKGQVTDDGVTAFTGSSKIKSGSLLINDEEFINKTGEKIDAGTTITGYYVVEDDENILKFFYTDEKTNSVVEYKDDYIESFDGAYTYEVYRDAEKNKTKKIKLDKAYKLIYNGEAFVPDESISEKEFYKMMKPEHGSVKFIDSNADEVYDVISITNYQMIIVGGIDRVNKIIYDKTDSALSINFEELDDYKMYNVEDPERDMALERIVRDNIIYAAIGYNKTCAEILVSTKTVTGKVQSINKDEVKINGKVYDITGNIITESDIEIIRGASQVMLYLTPDDKVVTYSFEKADDTHFVYLYKAKKTEDDETYIQLQIYTDTNEYKKVRVAKSVKVDGKTYKEKNIDALVEYLNSHRYGVGSLILVKYNANDEINFIDLAYNEEDNDADCFGQSYKYPHSNESKASLHIARGIIGYDSVTNYKQNNKFKQYRVSNGMLGDGQLAVTIDTLVFNIPIDSEGEDCLVTTPNDIASDGSTTIQNYSVTAYSVNEDSIIADAFTINDKKCAKVDLTNYASAGLSKYYIVSEVEQTINSFGDPCAKFKVYANKDYHDFYTVSLEAANGYYGLNDDGSQRYKEVEVGDVVMFGTDKYGRIPENQIRIMYSPKTDKDKVAYRDIAFNVNTAGTTQNYMKGLNLTWINKIEGQYIELAFDNPKLGTVKNDRKYILLNGTCDYVVYENGKVKLSDETQLVSYEQSRSDDCKTMLIATGKNVIYNVKD